MKLCMSIQETVINRYEVGGIELEYLQELFTKHNTKDVWKISNMYPGISVELAESCLDFIDADFESVELY